jgi:hypothetical protein
MNFIRVFWTTGDGLMVDVRGKLMWKPRVLHGFSLVRIIDLVVIKD